jgi:predicted membrane metal-binding protein
MTDVQGHSSIEVGSERSFGLVFAAFFGLVGVWPLLDAGDLRVWALAVAAVFLLAAFLAPSLLRPLNLLWFKLGMLLGRIVTPIVMFLLFFLTVLPTGLALRLSGKDPMHRKVDKTAPSYWIKRVESPEEHSSMKNQF